LNCEAALELLTFLVLPVFLLGISLDKPSWLRDALEGPWLNFYRGDWIDWLVVILPPFTFTPGAWTESAIDWILIPVNTILGLAEDAWNLATEAWNILTDFFWDVFGFVQGAVTWWYDLWFDVWGTAFQSVKDWVAYYYGFLIDQVPQLWEWFLDRGVWFAQMLADWTGDFWVTIGDYIWDTLGDIPSRLNQAWDWILAADDWVNDNIVRRISPLAMSLQDTIDFLDPFRANMNMLFTSPFKWLWAVLVEPLLGDFLDGFSRGLDEEDEP
jgi:hypothetical protein